MRHKARRWLEETADQIKTAPETLPSHIDMSPSGILRWAASQVEAIPLPKKKWEPKKKK